jgi:outer membrane protein OmpA-like peptidoglycan-associated protein
MNYKISVVMIALLSTFGCSQKPVDFLVLNGAKNSYLELKKDENIINNAPMEFYKAGKIYQMTKAVKTQDEADHLSFLLQNQVNIVRETASTKALEAKVVKLKDSKVQALLDEKENQILIMKKEAEKARLEAELARKEAELSRDKFLALQELNAKQTNRGLVLTLGDVLFETGKSNLLAGSMLAIDKLVEFLADNKERMVLIEGHTDNVGSSTSNLDLSLRRSGAVEEALVQKGISSDRLFVKGYGEAYPVASNDDSGGRQRNRRVEIVILEEGVDPSSMTRESQNQ